jgi:hypothetical protein
VWGGTGDEDEHRWYDYNFYKDPDIQLLNHSDTHISGKLFIIKRESEILIEDLYMSVGTKGEHIGKL